MSVLSANGLCGLIFEVCAGEFSGSNSEVGEREMPFKTTYSHSNVINEASLERPMDKLSSDSMQIVMIVLSWVWLRRSGFRCTFTDCQLMKGPKPMKAKCTSVGGKKRMSPSLFRNK